MNGHYINCGGHKRGNTVCPGRSRVITLEQIEDVVQAQLLDFLKSYRSVAIQANQHGRAAVNQIEMQISQLEQEIAQLTQNLAHIQEPDVIHIVAAQIHEANGKLEDCRAQRDQLLYQGQPTDLEPYFEAVLDEWPDYTIQEKKVIAKEVIERVDVDEDTIDVTFRSACGA